MTSQQHTVEQLFGEALEREPGQRRAFLDAACVGAPEIRRQVEELLLDDERAGSFLDRPAASLGLDVGSGLGVDLMGLGALARTVTPVECDGVIDPPPFAAPMVRFGAGDMIGGRFHVVRFVARGGMGEVYEVEDTLLQNVHVALKIILPQIAGDAGSARRFEQEVLLARKVVHPNLCPIYDISRSNETTPPFLFMTMKLLEGETLAARLRNGMPVTRADSGAIFRQMIAGIGAIHDGGVIHRDIKPNNVMLEYTRGELCCTIMDFGLARLHGSETTVLTRGLVAGTPGYIAPELLRGQCPSAATDVFALGVLLHQVLTGEHPVAKANSLSTEPVEALASADAPTTMIESVREFLSDDPARRLTAFRLARDNYHMTGSQFPQLSRVLPMSRRAFAIGGAVAAVGVVGGAAWRFDWIDDLMHPIPAKRFVALLNWPETANGKVAPMVNGVIDAIAEQLSRVEAFDHNLFVATQPLGGDVKSPAQLNEVRDSLGANLVLAASGTTRDDRYHVNLRLLDPSSTRTLRERTISSPIEEQALLPQRAIAAAEKMLSVSARHPVKPAVAGGTKIPEAFAAFQAAEALRKEENGTGLDASIEKYKDAIDFDPKYALAHTQLAFAYCRWYHVHHDSAALDLARNNAEAAIAMADNLVDGHLALGEVMKYQGDESGALREMGKALALDPSNSRTLIYQAQVYTRLNRWDDAERSYRRVLKQRPNYWLAYQELAYNFYSQGKYSDALASFRAASLAAPGNALALANVGAMYLLVGDLVRAYDNLSRSIKLEDVASTRTNLATTLRDQSKNFEAVQCALRGIELSPVNPDGWRELGDCYAALGGHAIDAKNAYVRACSEQQAMLDTDPSDGSGWVQLALLKIKSGLPEQAPALLKKAERLNSGDVDSQLTRVRIFELLGDRQGALAAATLSLRMGADKFQIQTMSDLESFRNDPRYKALIKEQGAGSRT